MKDTPTSEYIRDLRSVIKKIHGVQSHHSESVSVVETFEGQIVWEGVVEVFQLRNHPKSDRVYAWSYEIDGTGKRHYVTVLHVDPITSPVLAVRAAIVQEHRSHEQKESRKAETPKRSRKGKNAES